MNRAERRQLAHARSRVKPVAHFEGVPVYDASVTRVAVFSDDAGEVQDARVLLGVGLDDVPPIAYLTVCPCEGVDGLVADLVQAGADAQPYHDPHGLPHTESRPDVPG